MHKITRDEKVLVASLIALPISVAMNVKYYRQFNLRQAFNPLNNLRFMKEHPVLSALYLLSTSAVIYQTQMQRKEIMSDFSIWDRLDVPAPVFSTEAPADVVEWAESIKAEREAEWEQVHDNPAYCQAEHKLGNRCYLLLREDDTCAGESYHKDTASV